MCHGKRLQYLCFILVVCVLVVGAVFLVFYNRHRPAYQECGPESPGQVELVEPFKERNGSYSSPGVLGLTFPPGTFRKTTNGSVFGCICSVKPCIRKCCPYEKEYSQSHQCITSSSDFWYNLMKRGVYSKLGFFESVSNLQRKTVGNDSFHFLYDPPPCKHSYPMNKTETPSEDNVLMEDGRILVLTEALPYLNTFQYCLDSVVGDETIYTIACFKEPEDYSDLEYAKAAGMLLSIPFLLVTLLAFALVPERKNLHRKLLLSHLASLIVAYSVGAISKIAVSDTETKLCKGLAITMQFSFLACFFWLNAVCINIWLKFRTSKSPNRSKETDRRKFRLYSLYAWGGPLVVTAVSGVMDVASVVPKHYIKPGFGVSSCWFNGTDAQLVYFHLPIGVLATLNLVMFACMASLVFHSKEAFKGSDSKRHSADEKRYKIYMRIFILMGINWIMEIISFVIGGSGYYWMIFDLCNTLQGPIIFMLFCKRAMLRSLIEKLCPGCTRSDPAIIVSLVTNTNS